MTAIPIVYQVPSTTVQQSGALRPEDLEVIPYPPGTSSTADATWPPAGFTDVTAAAAAAVSSSGTPTTSLLPEPYNIEWIQGDTAVFQWLFADVLLTDADPGIVYPGAPTWQPSHWNAQARNPYIYSTYAADYWVPAYGYQYNWWRGHSIVANFAVEAASYAFPVPETEAARWGTLVTMTLPASESACILPGNWYRWDLQTRTYDPDLEDVVEHSVDAVRTRLRGSCRVVTEWTVA